MGGKLTCDRAFFSFSSDRLGVSKCDKLETRVIPSHSQR